VIAGCSDKPKFTPEQLAAMPLPKRDGLPTPSGGFALTIGEQTVTAEEVIAPVFEKLAIAAQKTSFEQFKQIAEPAVEQQVNLRISDCILYSKAKKDAGEQIDAELDRATTAEVRRFVMDFGGDYAKAEQALKQMGMDWGKFEQFQRRRILSQSYLAQQMPDRDQPVSYNEMINVYNNTKDKLYTTPASLQFRLIDIEPAILTNVDANKPRLEQAKELAGKIYDRIKQGEDFEQLAKEYSLGLHAAQGGLWRKVDPESMASPYDVLVTKAQTMKPGEVTQPIENLNHIFIMQLVDYQPKSVEPFEKVQNQIKASIAVERMRQAFAKIDEELLQQASAADKAKFIDFCLREIYRMANK
jgi:peptidyl-prolyl cis-trans isomerase SurA